MATRIKSKHAAKLAETSLVYWHSGVSLADAVMYIATYQLKLTRAASGTRH